VVLSPKAAREADLAEAEHMGLRDDVRDAPAKPSAALQLAMAPAGAFCNFCLAPGGASTWVHVISGKKVHATASQNRPCSSST
jgi:hypothetical protein